MALRGPAGLGPGSRGPLDEAVAAAEGREAPALVAAGATLEDDEEDDGRGRGLLRWDGFSAWLHCVCVVGFDLELGQAVEVRPGRTLSARFAPARARLAPAEPVARGPAGQDPSCRSSGRGPQSLRGLGLAAVRLPFSWEDLGLWLGLKCELFRPLLNACLKKKKK